MFELADITILKLKEKKIKKQMVIVKYPYYRAKVSDFKYEKGSMSHATSFEPILKDRWDDRKKLKFLAEVKKYKEFRITAEIISENFQMETIQADYLIESFVNRIINENISDISEKTKLEIISMFIADFGTHTKKLAPNNLDFRNSYEH